MFIVDANVDGIKRIKLDMADSREYANIEFNDVMVSDEDIIGELESGGENVEKFLI